MAFRKLQLNLLSQSGELINCVSCFAGQVAVFRAPSYAALEVYQRALAGIPGPERISIFLDDNTLIPSEHFFVGFGEQRENAHEPVLNSFLHLGVTEEIIDTLMNSYDISIDQSTPWNALSKCEARRARLLLATKTRNQVIILNDPFEPLANQWRERFAELIVTFARQTKAIVVVTNLSFRPESWIDNQSIARIQVGEEIQRTIGFGAQQGKGNDLVSQIREIMKDDAKVAELLNEKAPSRAHQQVETFPLRQSSKAEAIREQESREDEGEVARPALAVTLTALLSRFGLSTERLENSRRFSLFTELLAHPVYSALIAGTVIIGGGLYLVGSKEEALPGEPVVIAEKAPVVAEQAPVSEAPETDVATIQRGPTEAVIPEPPAPPPAVRSALDEYSESIKKSILVSYQGLGRSGGELTNRVVEQPARADAPKEEAGELLKLLATASDTGEGLPDSPPPSQQQDNDTGSSYQQGAPPPYTSEEEKREAIRKRFLEAIERAQNMKRQQSGQGEN